MLTLSPWFALHLISLLSLRKYWDLICDLSFLRVCTHAAVSMLWTMKIVNVTVLNTRQTMKMTWRKKSWGLQVTYPTSDLLLRLLRPGRLVWPHQHPQILIHPRSMRVKKWVIEWAKAITLRVKHRERETERECYHPANRTVMYKHSSSNVNRMFIQSDLFF